MAHLRLTDTQRELIAHCQVDASQSISQLSKRMGIRERSVRHHLGTLVSRGVLHEAPFVNIYPLNYRYVNLYFSVSSSNTASLEQLVQALIQSPRVAWLAELGGDFHFGASLIVEHVEEVKNTLDALSRRFPDIFFEKSYVFHLNLSVFPPKYLASRKIAASPLGYGSTGTVCPVDELDRKIISLMARKHICSGRALARELKKPHTTIELRIRRLEREKVISGYWYMFDTSKLGYQTLKLLVYAKGHPFDLSLNLAEFAKRHPNIVYFIECLGSWDFELGIDVGHVSEVAAVTRGLLDEFAPSINTIKVVPMFRVLKWCQYHE